MEIYNAERLAVMDVGVKENAYFLTLRIPQSPLIATISQCYLPRSAVSATIVFMAG